MRGQRRPQLPLPLLLEVVGPGPGLFPARRRVGARRLQPDIGGGQEAGVVVVEEEAERAAVRERYGKVLDLKRFLFVKKLKNKGAPVTPRNLSIRKELQEENHKIFIIAHFFLLLGK